jgi:hypothetical protein
MPTKTPTTLKDVAEQLHKNGYQLVAIPPGKKGPIDVGWNDLPFNLALYKGWVGNGRANWGAGVRLGDRMVALDIDVTDARLSEALLAEAESELGFGVIRVGQAPKQMILYQAAESVKKLSVVLTDPNGDEHKIEILGDGQQIAAFAVHPKTKQPYFYPDKSLMQVPLKTLPTVTAADINRYLDRVLTLIPSGWSLKSRAKAQVVETENKDGYLENYRKPPDATDEEVSRWLESIDPDIDYDEWLRIGMALHHWKSGGAAGLVVWENWSRGGTKFKEEDCQRRWNGFSAQVPSQPPVILGTVKKMAVDGQRIAELNLEQEWRKTIEGETNIIKLRKDIPTKIKELSLDSMAQEALAQSWRKRMAELPGGFKCSIGYARETLTAAKKRPRIPEWCWGWVFVQDSENFFHLQLKQELSTKAFDITFEREMLRMDDDTKSLTPTKFITGYCDIENVFQTAYHPEYPEIFEISGVRYANLYDPSQVPVIPIEYSKEDIEAIRIVKEHFPYLIEDETEQKILMMWLAHNVKWPGRKIRWSPLIWGAEGDGKSFFGVLMGTIMGEKNIRTQQATILESQFTGWAHGQAICVFEEVHTPGKNRHEVTNRLKPFITNDSIDVHKKNQNSFNAPNTTNYMFLTNYEDCLPMSDSSRRYFVLRTRFADEPKDLRELEARKTGYYKKLFGAVAAHPAGIRKGFMEMEIDWNLFDPNGHAPVTEQKERMSRLSDSDIETAIEDLLANPSEGVTSAVISRPHLDELLNQKRVGAHQRTVSKILRDKGFIPLNEILKGNDNRVRFKGAQVRVWVKKGPAKKQPQVGLKVWAVDILSTTIGGEFNSGGSDEGEPIPF